MALRNSEQQSAGFVARDSAGRWHVIECKGTQSGSEYSKTQLGTKGPPPTGGVAQKCSIRFPPGHTGQRLVCGLSIDVEGGTGSVLKIVDPEPEDAFEISLEQLVFADDAANRGVMSRVLRMAGFEVTAEAVASPFGRRPDTTPATSSNAEILRKLIVAERDERSRSELRDTVERRLVFDGKFRGREIALELPRAIMVNEGPVRRVIITQGVNREALEELEHRPTVEELADENHASWTRFIGKSVVEANGLVATMRIGNVFRSEIVLE